MLMYVELKGFQMNAYERENPYKCIFISSFPLYEIVWILRISIPDSFRFGHARVYVILVNSIRFVLHLLWGHAYRCWNC